MRILLTIICLCYFSLLFAQQEGPDVRKGNNSYKKENYTEAEVSYRRGLVKNPQSFEAHFNLGDALFRQEKYPEALEQYMKSKDMLNANDKLQEEQLNSRLAATYHNMGNAFYAQQQYADAVTAYQQSLRYNPKDDETRYNMVKAMKQRKHQQEQEQQDQSQNQNQQQNDSTQQQRQQQQEQQQQNQNQQPQQQEQQMDKETAEQILQALEQDEQETQEKLQRQQSKKRRLEKEW